MLIIFIWFIDLIDFFVCFNKYNYGDKDEVHQGQLWMVEDHTILLDLQ